MKREELIKCLNRAGDLMDEIGGAIVINRATGQSCECSEIEIRAMQSTIAAIVNVLKSDAEIIVPVKFAYTLITSHCAYLQMVKEAEKAAAAMREGRTEDIAADVIAQERAGHINPE